MDKNNLEIRPIRTRDLRSSDVPAPQREWLPTFLGRDDWSFINFALSFDGYSVLGDDAGEVCNMVRAIFERRPNVLDMFNTTGLRILLFFEQRRAKWNDENQVDDYSNTLVRMIRSRLEE